MDADFTNHSENHFYYYGGNSELSSANDSLSRWAVCPSLSRGQCTARPWVFSGQLVPIEVLITDETIQAQVTRAKLFRQARLQLEDIRDTIGLSRVSIPEDDLVTLKLAQQYLDTPNKTSNGDLIQMAGKITTVDDKVYEMQCE